jgi:hypothetical protein
MLSELKLARVDAKCGSAMKCGTVNTMDPMPITMEPGNMTYQFEYKQEICKLYILYILKSWNHI